MTIQHVHMEISCPTWGHHNELVLPSYQGGFQPVFFVESETDTDSHSMEEFMSALNHDSFTTTDLVSSLIQDYHLTQKEIANHVGVSTVTVKRWQMSTTRNNSCKRYKKLLALYFRHAN